MPEPQAMEGSAMTGDNLLTLTEVSKKTGISMPTLQRYKRMYQSRIPSEGRGRKQRYPASALPVFEELKTENVGRRGRPRKSEAAAKSAPKARGAKPAAKAAASPMPPARGRKASASPVAKKAASASKAPAAKKAAAKPAATGKAASVKSAGLLTLTQVAKKTGISYPTLVRYVKMKSKEIPHEGSGRKRRFLPEAVDIFKQMRGESRRGGKSTAAGKSAAPKRATKAAAGRGRAKSPGIVETVARGAEKRIKSLEKSIKGLEKKLGQLLSRLAKPRRVI